uniref:Uncharacterized protein n=1 Tax=Myoviridae sp. ctuSi15 TaxID=2826708 RepID=A0A8S5MNQ9_9CAUD|nr:MAG TPA: hypothetical protein [Myoviridae sp. ctuSi15]
MQQSRLFAQCCGHNIKGVFDDCVQHLVGDSPADGRRALGAESREHLLLLFGTLPAAHDGPFGFFDQLQRQILDGGLVAQPDATDCQSDKARQHQDNGDGSGNKVQHSFHDIASYKYQRRGEPPLRRFVVLVISDVSQVLGSPGNGLPAGGAADAVHSQPMRLLCFQQSVLCALAENAVRGQPQQPLEHLRGRPVCIPGAAPADGRQNELLVGGAGVVLRGIAQPRCLCIAGVGVHDSAAVIPVDAHRLEILGGDDTQGHRIDAAVYKPPIRSHTIAVLAARAAADCRIMREAAVSAGHLDGLAQLVPDGLKFFDQLRIDHLAAASTGALEVLAGEVLAQGRCVAGLIDDDSHVENLLQEKSCF